MECVEGEVYEVEKDEVYEGRHLQMVSSFPKDARCASVRMASASGLRRRLRGIRGRMCGWE
jgi:hypothetical protein